MTLSIGLDVGTTTIKAAAYDAAGRAMARAERATLVLRSADGSNEQDPMAVWTETAACLKALARQIEGADVGSLGICAQGDGFWPLDERAQPVRHAILWSDTRPDTAADLAQLRRAGALDIVGRGCDTALWPGTSALGWRWLRTHEPTSAAKVAHVVTCGDWIGAQLTGAVATDFANASIPFMDIERRRYGDAIMALDCEDMRAALPAPRKATDILGELTTTAAQQTGLPQGTPVSVATLDIAAMIAGLGLSKPGDAMMILGTTAVVTILRDTAAGHEPPVAAAALHATEDVIIRILAPSTGAAAFDWFATLHPQSLGGESAGAIADKLNALVREIPIGANGVTFLPYLNGERAPFVSPAIRASFIGMSSTSTKGELGRAVMEGTAYSLRHCFETEGGLPDVPVHLTGGGARNPVWCQIIADVMGQDVLVKPADDLGLWGASCIGRAAVTGENAIGLTRRQGQVTRYRCDATAHAAYEGPYARYTMLSDAMRGVQHALNQPKGD
ncbi:FGGY family carbohydrate kinase [uncultured Roseobacter sp.]|uniref:xylulokinase n=1 Tax=uncultured Roseobacter sp. TaxID=114847 RepID=UPI00261BE81A|nr:FGGY family carbohydrate kinase [uncultured Roseobacter sp.]